MPYNPETLKNLRPFPPGQNGGGGRKKGSINRSTILEIRLQKSLTRENLNKEQETATAYEHMVNALILRALDGDVKAIQEIQDTLFGKLSNPVMQADIDNDYDFTKLTSEELDSLNILLDKSKIRK